MISLWRWLMSLLVWLSADPSEVDLEAPRAAAAASVARASMAVDSAPPSPPSPTCDCGQTCVRGVWKPDTRIPQACKCACARCVAERAKACQSGTCPPR
jgi:hypothetical protein